MLRRTWKPVAAAVAVGGPAYIYYRSSGSQSFELDVPTRGPDGKRQMTTRTFPLYSLEAALARIRQNTSSITERRPGLVWRYDTASLPSNDPIEDANAQQFIQRDATDPAGQGDFVFFAVMDGHAGNDTSQLLSKILVKAAALKINSLNAKPAEPGLFSKLWGAAPASNLPVNAQQNPDLVTRAIQNAFFELDNELVKAPMRILADNWTEEMRKKNIVPDLSKHPLGLQSMLPALSGSCAIMAIFDTANRNLYVANTGDCRAVAGVWTPSSDGNGSWSVDVLSEDQTGRNPKELERIQSEHPESEKDDVVKRGRMLGGLEPSRAFGDARYKWPLIVQATLNEAFMEGNNRPMRGVPPNLKTPPYVTAKPEVTHRKLAPPSEKGSLRFLVLATDGLWDALSSEEVVGLVGGHLAGLKGKVHKQDLAKRISFAEDQGKTVEGKDHHRESLGDSWIFEETNLGSHLIRNALGGGNEIMLRQLISIPAPYSRRHRDDITVTVVTWEEGSEHDAHSTRVALPQRTQAKL